MHQETRYRLRKKNQIVGYMRKINEKNCFYSPDSFWWSGRKIGYEEIDEWTGLYDKNRKAIYEWDILRFKIDPDGDYCTGVVLWEARNERFIIRKVDEELCFPLSVSELLLFNTSQLEVFSYLFLNPELKYYLGIEED
jgi:hypothetical protein